MIQMRRNIDFLSFFLLFTFSPTFPHVKTCQWINFRACKSMESAWINRSPAVASWRDRSDSPAAAIGRICKSTPSLTQSTTSAWVRRILNAFESILTTKFPSRNRRRLLRTRRRCQAEEARDFELGSHPVLSREIGGHCARQQRTFVAGKSNFLELSLLSTLINLKLLIRQLTWADFYFAGIIDYLNYLAKQDLTANHENLRKVIENVTSLDGVQNWINTRPATEM